MQKKLNLDEIQEEEFSLLQMLNKLLKEKNIDFYLFGGTLLGAVRHKGFVPWDDDIDLAIPREQYEELIQMIRNKEINLDNDYEFMGFELGNDKYPFIKLVNKKIKIVQQVKVDKYLWIDIFPLDYIPDDKKYKKFLKKAFAMHQIISLKMMTYRSVFKSSKTIKTRLIKIFLWPIVKIINMKKYTSKYILFCKKYYKKTSTIGNVIWCANEKENMPIEILDKDYITFENHRFKCFKNYDYYLSRIYGDYMKLPPENKRYTHTFDAYKIK